MTTNKKFTLALLASTLLGVAVPVLAQSEQTAITLDQAVSKVQQETHGRVLSAEPHHMGHRREYRIKVLTPEGHVKVIAVSATSNNKPASTSSTKNSPARRAGSKEKR
ncbi:MAG: hypothetical protein ABI114_15640 [Rhodanobacter sp.]